MERDVRTFGYFAIASAAAVGLGAAGLGFGGAGTTIWVRNPAAWLVGLGAAASILAAGRSQGLARAAILLTLIGFAATLVSPAQSGVHRWIDAGAVQINIAALLLPLTLVALATARLAAIPFLAAVGLIGLLLVIQPDASQATAFLLPAGFLLLRSRMPPVTKGIGMLGMAVLAVGAWLRPDPLEPVPEVEGILSYLADISLPLAAAAVLALAVTAVIPLRRAPAADEGLADAAKALALHFILVALMPAVGAFPVPLVGLGMSFPVGYLLGVALLCACNASPPLVATD
jgi:cell division protein FtsW (lipid II flippase)